MSLCRMSLCRTSICRMSMFECPCVKCPRAECPCVGCPCVECPCVECPCVDCPCAECPCIECPCAEYIKICQASHAECAEQSNVIVQSVHVNATHDEYKCAISITTTTKTNERPPLPHRPIHNNNRPNTRPHHGRSHPPPSPAPAALNYYNSSFNSCWSALQLLKNFGAS